MRNLFGLNNKKSGQDHHIVSNIQIQNNYENKVSKISSVDQLSEIIIVALQIICESFDDRSLPPRLSKFTRSSLDVIKLSQRMLNGDVSKGTFESLEDIDKIWYVKNFLTPCPIFNFILILLIN